MDNQLLEDIDRVYKGLQNLQITATKANTAIVLDALQVLESLYQHLKGEKYAATDVDNSWN
jgi:hypothetical protein